MFKRLFSAMLGLGVGLALGVWAVRKIEQTQRRLSREHLTAVAAERAGGLRERLGAAVEEGRAAAAAKEAELRAVYRGGTGEPPTTG
jgi:hypothetical protein